MRKEVVLLWYLKWLASTCVHLNSTYRENGVVINIGYLHVQVDLPKAMLKDG